jgi:hypothetical protein
MGKAALPTGSESNGLKSSGQRRKADEIVNEIQSVKRPKRSTAPITGQGEQQLSGRIGIKNSDLRRAFRATLPDHIDPKDNNAIIAWIVSNAAPTDKLAVDQQNTITSFKSTPHGVTYHAETGTWSLNKSALKINLYIFQVYEVAWIMKALKLRGTGMTPRPNEETCCILDLDTGTGKTIITLAFLSLADGRHAYFSKTLIIVPPQLKSQWENEMKDKLEESFFAKCLIYDRNQPPDSLEGYHAVLATHQDIILALNPKSGSLLLKTTWNNVFLDECQRFKGMATIRFKAFAAIKAKCRVIMSGTYIVDNFHPEMFTYLTLLKVDMPNITKRNFHNKWKEIKKDHQDKILSVRREGLFLGHPLFDLPAVKVFIRPVS